MYMVHGLMNNTYCTNKRNCTLSLDCAKQLNPECLRLRLASIVTHRYHKVKAIIAQRWLFPDTKFTKDIL